MADLVKTIAQILELLNAENKGIWILINGYYALIEPHVLDKTPEDGKNVNYNFPTNGIVLKAFLNTSTGEIRTFVAKFTDDPKKEIL